jgi:hypothetical protein
VLLDYPEFKEGKLDNVIINTADTSKAFWIWPFMREMEARLQKQRSQDIWDQCENSLAGVFRALQCALGVPRVSPIAPTCFLRGNADAGTHSLYLACALGAAWMPQGAGARCFERFKHTSANLFPVGRHRKSRITVVSRLSNCRSRRTISLRRFLGHLFMHLSGRFVMDRSTLVVDKKRSHHIGSWIVTYESCNWSIVPCRFIVLACHAPSCGSGVETNLSFTSTNIFFGSTKPFLGAEIKFSFQIDRNPLFLAISSDCFFQDIRKSLVFH